MMIFYPSEFLPEYRPVRKFPIYSTNGWWLNRWPFLGWLETFVKMAAWVFVMYVPLPDAKPLSPQAMSPSFVLETAIMLLASALIAAAVIDRMIYRELVSIVFVFPNNWAHWSITMAMLRYGRSGINVRCFRIFCWLMFAGDLVKLLFFAVHDFSRLNVSRYVLYFLVFLFAAFYGAVLSLDYGYFKDTAASICTALSLQQRLASVQTTPTILQSIFP